MSVHSVTTGVKGTLTVYVRGTDGTSLSTTGLAVRLWGRWKDAPPAPPSDHFLRLGYPSDGEVIFNFSLPPPLAGQTVTFVVTASGKTYQAVAPVECLDNLQK